MSQVAVYKGRKAYLINETSADMNRGPRINWGDNLLFRVDWGDEDLIVDPTDCEWSSAEDMFQPVTPKPTTGFAIITRRMTP